MDHTAFKSCLRALGYDLPMVKEPEPEFEAILNVVDPNRFVQYSALILSADIKLKEEASIYKMRNTKKILLIIILCL